MACTKYKQLTTVQADGTATDIWLDMSTSPPTTLPGKPKDAKLCVEPQYVVTEVCATIAKNVNEETGAAIDPTLVVKNVKCVLPMTPECDGTTTVGAQKLVGPDGTDLTADHVAVPCPVTTTFSTDYCGAAGEVKEEVEA